MPTTATPAALASEISVLDIVEAIEGPNSAFECTEIRQRGICATPPEMCVRACP